MLLIFLNIRQQTAALIHQQLRLILYVLFTEAWEGGERRKGKSV